MRYMVKVKQAEQFKQLLECLKQNNVAIALQNEKRLFVAIESVSRPLRAKLGKIGASIAVDTQVTQG